MFVKYVIPRNNVFNVKKQTTAKYVILLSTEIYNQSMEHASVKQGLLKAIQLIFVSHVQFLDAQYVPKAKFVQNVLLHCISKN